MSPFSTLTIDHLVWRMRHVNRQATVTSLEDGSVTTLPELAGRAELCASALEKCGVTEGSKIATLAWSSADHLVLLLAGGLLGCVATCINPRLPSVEVRRILDDSETRVAFVAPAVLDRHDPVGVDLADILAARSDAGTPLVALGPSDDPAHCTFERFLSLGEEPWRRRPITEDAPVAAFFTGGTTGSPKPVVVSQRSLILHALAQATVDALGISSRDRVMPGAPLFHVAGWGMPVTALLVGADLVLPGRDLGAATLVEAMENYAVTVAGAVPTLWVDIARHLEAESRSLPLLREIVTGGSAVPTEVVTRLSALTDATIAGAWGMTETLACSTYERSDPAARVGRVIPLIETRVVPSGSVSAVDDVAAAGTLHVRGPFVHTEAEDGWLDTQDVVEIDPLTGDIAIKDRVKDLVKSGGEWISPAAVESAIAGHPQVTSVAVVAQPHPRWMERPFAYVVLEPGAELTEADITGYLGDKIPKWWIPNKIRFLRHLPLTAVGKVDKQELRVRAAAEISLSQTDVLIKEGDNV